jgi:hypothetical protein
MVSTRRVVSAALEHRPMWEPSELSADTLRLRSTVQDSPLSPELVARYIEPHP